ncbi:hypothetical protein Tco_1274424 [Tanacetum coccineum]
MVDFEKCSLHPPGKSFDLVEAYGSKNPTLFTLKINHGGFLTLGSPKHYMNGKVNWFDGVDSDEFSIHELSEMLKLLGYKNESMFYRFKIPNSGLDLGLKPLVSDCDVTDMFKQVGSIKVIEVYIEPWFSAVDYERNEQGVDVDVVDIGKESKNWPPHFEMTNEFGPFFYLNTVFEKGKSSMPNIGEDEDVMVDEDNILKDVQVDMGDFRRKYNKNAE